MAGEGFAFHANNILKYNRGLLSKKDFFYLRSEYLKSAQKKSLNLKKATPAQLAVIRAEVKSKNNRIRKQKIVAVVVACFLTAILLYAITEGIKYMFETSPYSTPERFF